MIERLELWSDCEPAGGVRRALVGEWTACTETVSLDGEDRMSLSILRNNAALVTSDTPIGETNAEPGRVLRCVLSDGAMTERRIVSIEERDDDGMLKVQIEAQGMMYDLSNRGLARRVTQGGRITHSFRASGLTPYQHLSLYILPALAEAGATWWITGVIESDAPVTMDYDKDSPLSALRKLLANTDTRLELAVRFDRVQMRYAIDLLQRVGATAPLITAHSYLNLQSLGLVRSNADQVRRIYAFGATDEERGVGTIGENVWLTGTFYPVAGQTNQWTVVLSDPAGGPGPVAFDGQYVGLVLTNFYPDGETYYILDTRTDSQLFTVSLRTVGARRGGALSIRSATGDPDSEISYVEVPGLTSDPGGVAVGVVERPELPGVRNLLFNPTVRLWMGHPVGNLPVGWATNPTGVTYSKETNPLYWRTSGASWRLRFPGGTIAFGSARTGFLGAVDEHLPIRAGTLSFFLDCMVLVGGVGVQMTVELETEAGGQYPLMPDGTRRLYLNYPADLALFDPTYAGAPPDELGELWRNKTIGSWERLGAEAVHDASTYPIVWATVLVHQLQSVSIGSDVCVDAAQLTNTRRNHDLVEGSGANALLAAANERLRLYGGIAESFSLDALDLTTVDDEQFPYNTYIVGGSILIRNPDLGQTVQARVLGWSRDWLHPEAIRVQISQAPADITKVIATRAPSALPMVLR